MVHCTVHNVPSFAICAGWTRVPGARSSPGAGQRAEEEGDAAGSSFLRFLTLKNDDEEPAQVRDESAWDRDFHSVQSRFLVSVVFLMLYRLRIVSSVFSAFYSPSRVCACVKRFLDFFSCGNTVCPTLSPFVPLTGVAPGTR